MSVIADDDIGAGFDQPHSFPGVDADAGFFVAGHADGHAADALDFLDFDEPVAEAEQTAGINPAARR